MFQRFGFVVALIFAAPSANAVEPPPLTDFSRHIQYDDVKISPDGEYLAAIIVVNDKRHLSLLNLKTLTGNNVRPRDGDELATFDWVSANRVIYTLGTKVGGIEKPFPTGELFAVNADGSGGAMLFGFRLDGQQTGSNIKQVTSERAHARLIDGLLDDDRNVLVATDSWDSGREGDFSKLWRMNVQSGKRLPITTAPIRAAQFLVDHKGQARFAYSEDVEGKLKVYYRGGDKEKWELVFDEASDGGRAIPIAFARDNETVYWKCANGGAVGGLCRWTDKERKFEALWSNRSVELESLITSFDGQDVVGVRALPGRPSLDPIRKGDETIKAIVALMQQFPGDDVKIVSATPDGRKVIVLVSADVNPGEFYLLDRETKKLSFLLARAPWIKPEQMGAMEPIEVKARDGMNLYGYLTRPVGKEEAKGLPLIVLPHGGPYGLRDVWGYDPEVQALASRGYAVLQLNFRGSGGYGYAYEKAGYGEWGAKMQDDLTDATQWAISSGVADAKRICIFGASYGGYAALQGAVREPALYRCAIGYVGVYDLPMMYSRGDIPQSRRGENYLKKVLGEDQQQLAQRSPINQLDRLKAKVMLIVGGQDKRVPPVHGENLHNALLKRKVEHEWLYQRTEGHGFYDEANVTDMYTKLIAFLDSNIGPSAKP
jgi:dipeptidyl aminopeptidase/acylaminoacyl peptidase